MTKKILLASLMVLPLAAVGCNKNKALQKSPKASLTELTPPSPTHDATSPSTYTPPVTPVTFDQPPADSQFNANTPAAAPATGSITPGGRYTVQRGDTLWSIAKRTYGDGAQYKRIVSANPSIRNNRLMVGQTINLPN